MCLCWQVFSMHACVWCASLPSVNDQLYKLTAGSSNEALTWVENLQGKRGEYMKVTSAMDNNAQEQDRDKRTLHGFRTKPMETLARPRDNGSPLRTPPGVRNIVLSKIRCDQGTVSMPVCTCGWCDWKVVVL